MDNHIKKKIERALFKLAWDAISELGTTTEPMTEEKEKILLRVSTVEVEDWNDNENCMESVEKEIVSALHEDGLARTRIPGRNIWCSNSIGLSADYEHSGIFWYTEDFSMDEIREMLIKNGYEPVIEGRKDGQ